MAPRIQRNFKEILTPIGRAGRFCHQIIQAICARRIKTIIFLKHSERHVKRRDLCLGDCDWRRRSIRRKRVLEVDPQDKLGRKETKSKTTTKSALAALVTDYPCPSFAPNPETDNTQDAQSKSSSRAPSGPRLVNRISQIVNPQRGVFLAYHPLTNGNNFPLRPPSTPSTPDFRAFSALAYRLLIVPTNYCYD